MFQLNQSAFQHGYTTLLLNQIFKIDFKIIFNHVCAPYITSAQECCLFCWEKPDINICIEFHISEYLCIRIKINISNMFIIYDMQIQINHLTKNSAMSFVAHVIYRKFPYQTFIRMFAFHLKLKYSSTKKSQFITSQSIRHSSFFFKCFTS